MHPAVVLESLTDGAVCNFFRFSGHQAHLRNPLRLLMPHPPPQCHVPVPSPVTVQLAFDLLDRMRAEGLAPSAVTYGCLLSACARRGDVGRAFQLYQQACDEVRWV